LDQPREPRVPVREMVDKKLAQGKLDGYSYASMPGSANPALTIMTLASRLADWMASRDAQP
ncbi:MAG: hypothetical protein ACRDL8_14050, partial [Solirubrobacteraceae bacterium]